MTIFEKEFENAPQEVKTKAFESANAFQRVKKARDQYQLWNAELEIAEQSHQIKMREYNEVLNRWNPTTNEMASGSLVEIKTN